jgi:hypothetical protein
MVSPLTGEPMETSAIVGYLQSAEFNEALIQISSANFTGNSTFYSKIETFTTGAAFVAWELIGLMTGTYIFNMMLIDGCTCLVCHCLYCTVYTLISSCYYWIREGNIKCQKFLLSN